MSVTPSCCITSILIPLAPPFHDLAADNAVYLHSGDRHLLASRGYAPKRPLVRASRRPADDDLVPFGDHFLNGKSEVREANAIPRDVSFDMLGTVSHPSTSGCVAVVRSKNLVYDGQVSRAKGILPETADDSFVLF